MAELHKRYSRTEALKAFLIADKSELQAFCDEQFFVLPKYILCFFAIGDEDETSHFQTPTRLTWRPSRMDYAPHDEWPWLPREVREFWDHDRKQKIREHHLFVRSDEDSKTFLYIGTSHLGSFGQGPNGATAHFYLHQKLTEENWLHFGGYAGWAIEMNHVAHHLATDDVSAFDKLLKGFTKEQYSHLSITRYQEDCLQIHTNPTRAWLMYLRVPADSGLYFAEFHYDEPQDNLEFFKCTCGISLEFPSTQTVSHDKALQLAREYFTTQKLPTTVDWFPM